MGSIHPHPYPPYPMGIGFCPNNVPTGRKFIPYPPLYRVILVGYSGFGYPLPSLGTSSSTQHKRRCLRYVIRGRSLEAARPRVLALALAGTPDRRCSGHAGATASWWSWSREERRPLHRVGHRGQHLQGLRHRRCRRAHGERSRSGGAAGCCSSRSAACGATGSEQREEGRRWWRDGMLSGKKRGGGAGAGGHEVVEQGTGGREVAAPMAARFAVRVERSGRCDTKGIQEVMESGAAASRGLGPREMKGSTVSPGLALSCFKQRAGRAQKTSRQINGPTCTFSFFRERAWHVFH
jgi:hypothetical protein